MKAFNIQYVNKLNFLNHKWCFKNSSSSCLNTFYQVFSPSLSVSHTHIYHSVNTACTGCASHWENLSDSLHPMLKVWLFSVCLCLLLRLFSAQSSLSGLRVTVWWAISRLYLSVCSLRLQTLCLLRDGVPFPDCCRRQGRGLQCIHTHTPTHTLWCLHTESYTFDVIRSFCVW